MPSLKPPPRILLLITLSFLAILAILFLPSSWAPASASPSERDAGPGAIVLFGDSLTEYGWREGGLAQRLGDRYVRKLDIVNRGFSGYNTAWALPVLQRLYPALQHTHPSIELLTIWIGANDAAAHPEPQHVPLPDFTRNLRSLLALLPPTQRVLLLTPPPCSPKKYPDRDAAAYAAAVREVGQARGVGVLDVFGAVSGVQGWEDGLLLDGLHLNAEGYKVVFDLMVGEMEGRWPELRPEALPSFFPTWNEIVDHSAPIEP